MSRFPKPTPNQCKAKKEQEEKEHDNGVREQIIERKFTPCALESKVIWSYSL